MWQTLMMLDLYHHQIQSQFAAARNTREVQDRLREMGLLDRINAITEMKGIGF